MDLLDNRCDYIQNSRPLMDGRCDLSMIVEHEAEKAVVKRNTLANYISQFYVTFCGILVLPLYLKYLGAESYGLVGFFSALQVWLSIIDLGMSPTLGRQIANERGRGGDFAGILRLTRSLEVVFVSISVMVTVVFVFSGRLIATRWLSYHEITTGEVIFSLNVMIVIAAIRWVCSLYRSGIQGMEAQVWLSMVNIITVTFKFIVVLALLHYYSRSIHVYFLYQLLISIIEMLILRWQLYRLMPCHEKVRWGIYWDDLRPVIGFAGGIGYVTMLWILVSQVDKVVLSGILPLNEYGYFMLAVIVSGGIIQLSTPINQAILPRLTYLTGQGRHVEQVRIYRAATQYLVIIIVSVTAIIAGFSSSILFAWTGDSVAAAWAGPVLQWFALGNALAVFSMLQYFLQFAHGELYWHVRFTTVSSLIQIPVIIYTAWFHGAVAVAFAWFILRLIIFICWSWWIHRMFLPGIHGTWLREDILPMMAATGGVLLLTQHLFPVLPVENRLGIFCYLSLTGMFILSTNLLVSSTARAFVRSLVQRDVKS